jgi:hypothetical protein
MELEALDECESENFIQKLHDQRYQLDRLTSFIMSGG